MRIRQSVGMTSPTDPADDPDRTLADFFAEIEQSGGPSLTADEHRVLAAGTDHHEFATESGLFRSRVDGAGDTPP
jgi:hypothetical protein